MFWTRFSGYSLRIKGVHESDDQSQWFEGNEIKIGANRREISNRQIIYFWKTPPGTLIETNT
jgi:hypothetical protein